MDYQEFGIDISRYNEGINLAQAMNEGVMFAILRASNHFTADVEFNNYYYQAKEINLPIGAYIYTMADNPAEAELEADFLINDVLICKQLELPVYIDIENDIYMQKSRAENSAIVAAFCERMEASDYFAGFYASKYFIDDYLDDSRLKAYSHWVAQWEEECTYEDKSVLDIWQFGGEINMLRNIYVAGYPCDQNYMYRDLPTIIKAYGLNGFSNDTNC